MNNLDIELHRKLLFKKGAPITITLEYLFEQMDECVNYFKDCAENGCFLEQEDDPFSTPEQEHLDFIRVKASMEGKISLLRDLCEMMRPDMVEIISDHFKKSIHEIWNVPEPTSAISEWSAD